MLNNISKILNIILVIIILFLGWKWYEGRKNYNNIYEANKGLKNLVENNQAEVIRYRDNLVEQEQLNLTLRDKESRALFENDSLRSEVKRLNSVLKYGDIGRVRSVDLERIRTEHLYAMNNIQQKMNELRDSLLIVNNNDTSLVDSAINDISFLKLPYHVYYKDTGDWFSLDFDVKKEGFLLNELTYKNEYNVTYYEKKQGFLKKPQPVVLIENKNPYSEITGMENVVVTPKPKFWQTTWFKFGVGAAIGGYVGYKISK